MISIGEEEYKKLKDLLNLYLIDLEHIKNELKEIRIALFQKWEEKKDG